MQRTGLPIRYVLTGPSGWIGRALLSYIEKHVGAPSACVTAFASKAGEIELPSGTLPVRPLETIQPEDVQGAHVIHLAYLTREKADVLGERAFTQTNIGIDDALMTALEAAKPASLFVASSGAALLAAQGADLHPYGVAKLRQEARFLAWAKAHGVSTIVGRIFNIAGPWINKLEAYAVSNFALQALSGAVIKIEAARPVFRSFLHIDDLCALIVGAAQSGVNRNRPVDLCGAEILEMADIAGAVVAACNNGRIVRPEVDVTQASVYLGNFVDTKVLGMEIGVTFAPFSVQVEDTVRWIEGLEMVGDSGRLIRSEVASSDSLCRV